LAFVVLAVVRHTLAEPNKVWRVKQRKAEQDRLLVGKNPFDTCVPASFASL
jgi:hypothetical protein